MASLYAKWTLEKYFYLMSRLYLLKARSLIRKSKDALVQIQLKRLKELIYYAYEYSPFYHKLFKSHQIHPSFIRSLNDLAKLPLVSKEMFREAGLAGIATTDIKRCILHRTSGTTGIPLELAYTMKDECNIGALWFRPFQENAFSRKDRLLRITDPLHFYKKRSRNLYEVSAWTEPKVLLRYIISIKPNVIESWPTSLYLIAKEAIAMRLQIPVKLIFTYNEILDEATRGLLRNVFLTDPRDMYGAEEAGCIAWQCERGNYHLNIDGLVVEFLRDGEPVSENERGEIVITNLLLYGTPVIRYRLGDIGIPLGIDQECKCGNVLPLMKIIEGKKLDFIILPSGKEISPHIPKVILGRTPHIKMFQVIQDSINHISVQIVPSKNFNETILNSLEKQLNEAFCKEVKVDIKLVDKIVYTSGFRAVRSLVSS